MRPFFRVCPDGRLWCGFQPGSSFSYSNTGYALLGHLIARLGGAPHPEVIRHRVLAPLGMTASLPAINDRDRARYANGYAPFSTTRPFLPRQPLIMGPWVDIDEASGGIASTSGDMARYLRFLIDAARGRPTAVLSPAAGRMLAASLADAPDFGPGARYGYGLATVPVGGRPCLHHTGGMLTFSSSLHADGEAGAACFASVNAGLGNGYRPRLVTSYAIELMRALRDGKAVSPPDQSSGARIDKPNEMAGRYFGSDGRVIDLVVRGAEVVLVSGGKGGRFVRSGEVFASDHMNYAKAPFRTDGKDGHIVALWWRGTRFHRNAHEPAPVTPDRLRALEGWYESNDPWVGGVVLHAQGDRIVVDSADTLAVDSGGPLFERDGIYSLTETDTVERLRFEAPITGRPSRLNFSGADMDRRAFPI